MGINAAAAQTPSQVTPPGRPGLVTDCDRRAAAPTDPDRPQAVDGIEIDAVVADLAIPACINAIRNAPNEFRFEFELSRAFHKAGRYSEEITELKTAAELGSVIALNNLAASYQSGRGVIKNEAEAVRLFRKAVDAGFPLAMTNLGIAYQQGLGVAQDNKEAARLYRAAANAGNSSAMVNLAYMYQKGLGVEKDDAEVERLYNSAINAGNAVAMANLGVMYELGLGIPKDEARAAALYRQGAEIGNAVAMYKLAIMLEDGRGGLSKSDSAAAQWLKRAADAGYAPAAATLTKSPTNTLQNLAATGTANQAAQRVDVAPEQQIRAT